MPLQPDIEHLDKIVSSLCELHSRMLVEVQRGWRKFQPSLHVSLSDAKVLTDAAIELERYKALASSVPEDLIQPRDVFVVMQCDETGRRAICQEVGVVDSLEAFAAFAKHTYADARPVGACGKAYNLHDKNGEDLGIVLTLMRYPLWEAPQDRGEKDQGIGATASRQPAGAPSGLSRSAASRPIGAHQARGRDL